ncbi:MAG: succinate dehydrogenase, hydrophobic membrane anchor protein, partial [Proteobacteria bacterium]|nr:succinate dehydrogenase, hydrophobic membrane anchor protein [Pseudomonadota bacterium]
MKNIAVTKWILQRVSAVILLPLLLWFLFIFLNLVKQDYQNIVLFFQDDIKFIITLVFLIISFFHMKI